MVAGWFDWGGIDAKGVDISRFYFLSFYRFGCSTAFLKYGMGG